MITCTKCKEGKDHSCFHKDARRKTGVRAWCKSCVNARYIEKYNEDPEAHKEKSRRYRRNLSPEARKLLNKRTALSVNYGLTLDQYNEMREKQNCCCDICKEHESVAGKKGLCVDHDHDTGAIRSLLCARCNTAFGLLREDPAIITSMLEYLKYHNEGISNG